MGADGAWSPLGEGEAAAPGGVVLAGDAVGVRPAVALLAGGDLDHDPAALLGGDEPGVDGGGAHARVVGVGVGDPDVAGGLAPLRAVERDAGAVLAAVLHGVEVPR